MECNHHNIEVKSKGEPVNSTNDSTRGNLLLDLGRYVNARTSYSSSHQQWQSSVWLEATSAHICINNFVCICQIRAWKQSRSSQQMCWCFWEIYHDLATLRVAWSDWVLLHSPAHITRTRMNRIQSRQSRQGTGCQLKHFCLYRLRLSLCVMCREDNLGARVLPGQAISPCIPADPDRSGHGQAEPTIQKSRVAVCNVDLWLVSFI